MLNINSKTAIATLTMTTVLAVGAMQQMQPAQAVELVTNGDFEAGFAGWTVASVASIGEFGFSRSGTRTWGTAFSFPRGSLSQTITGLTAGQSAILSFWVANAFADTLSGLDVSIGSLSLFNLSNTPPASSDPGNFVNFTAAFVSPSNAPALLFSGFNSPNAIFVDDVSIEAQAQGVPEPSSMMGLFALGGLMLGMKRTLRK